MLFLGDSVMDQQGNHAAVLLRQSGVQARVEAHWGSTLFTLGQYRNGRSHSRKPRSDTSVHWLSLAPRLIKRYQPTLIVAELDHNYWMPVPTDAHGLPISDLHSQSARRMIDTQLRSFVAALRADGARVMWVAPTPSNTRAPDLWPTMAATLEGLRVEVIDPNAALTRGGTRRRAEARDCAGASRSLWMDDQIHLTRFGAGLSGTALARAVAQRAHIRLVDAAAPGERTVAIVPWPNGYHLVQCDGSVFHFGEAPIVGSARSRIAAGGSPVVDALASPDGGLLLVRADGSVLGVGAEPPSARQSFDSDPVALRLRVEDPSGGYRVIHSAGRVDEFDGAADLGDAIEVLPTDPFARAWALAHPRPPVSAAGEMSGGFYVVTENGEVVARGAARRFGDTADLALFTD